MIEFEKKLAKKSDCCGCSSCAYVCPKNAIKMEEVDGILLPIVDSELCISCGMCIKHCPVIQSDNVEGNYIQRIYSAFSTRDEVRKKSSSGGISRELINAFNSNYTNSVIYGSMIDETLEVAHKKATQSSEFDQFYGSKYTTSDISSVFDQIKQDISNGADVLFIGTPCQVAAINMLITSKKEKKHLFLVDVICHGPGVNSVWKDYISFIQSKYGKIDEYYFRDKSGGWRNYSIKAVIGKRKISNSPALKIWSYLFFRGYIQRESCFECKFANIKRFSDITLGDFWGIEKINPLMADNEGVSFVAINSNKGEMLFSLLDASVIKNEEDYKSALKTQDNLNGGRLKPVLYEQFWKDYKDCGFVFVANKYGSYSLLGQIRTRILFLLYKIGILQCIKKIIRK